MTRIQQARTPAEMAEVRRLFREYEAFLQVDLCFQGFEDELSSLPGEYVPPQGALLLALDADKIVGCVALRRLEEGVCEMKRLFVRPPARGRGLGRRLAQRIIDVARQAGYSSMRLDTLDRLVEAMRLYESLGFRITGAYYENPIPGAVYWELDLRESGPSTPGRRQDERSLP